MSTSKWTSVITNAGKNLLSYISEQHIVITKAQCGGTRTEGNLEELTDIQNPKDMVLYPPQSIENNLQFRITLSNQNISTGFSLYQIGIYAKLEKQEDDVLFMVIQATENQPDIIPSNQESPNYVNDYVVRLIVANTDQITVQVTADAYATTGFVLDLKTELKSNIQNLQNTKLDITKLNAPNGAAGLDASGKLQQMPTASDVGAVPTSRTVNSKPLSSDIVLNAADINAIDASLLGQANGVATLNSSNKLVQMPTSADVGAVPTDRTINGIELSSNITLSTKEIGEKNICLASYRIGDLMFTTIEGNPGNDIGGTWAAWGQGRTPVGVNTADTYFNTVEKTGGEKTHKLTVNELPSDIGNFNTMLWQDEPTTGAFKLERHNTNTSSNPGTDFGGATIRLEGGGQAHNNLQPYITCYIWKRTA